MPENIYYYLHKRQLLNEDAAINGNYMVHPIKTRNDNMKILMTPKDSLFIKQLDMDKVSTSLFNREVLTYQLFKNYSDFSAIAAHTTALLDYDDENNVIVMALVPNSKNLSEHYMLQKTFDLNIAEQQAKIIADCHIKINEKVDTTKYPKALPWVLQINQHKAEDFFVNNTFSANILSLIKGNDLLINTLTRLAKSWQFTHLIHGDIKWINFLITQEGNEIQQKLIDWELADIGDPVWDVAGLVQSYISTWLLGFDNANPFSEALPEHFKSFDIKQMQPSAKAFLYKYMALKKFEPAEEAAFLIKTIELSAARILQTSVEGITYHSKIEANNMRCIQVAFNILKDPKYALSELFNIKINQYV